MIAFSAALRWSLGGKLGVGCIGSLMSVLPTVPLLSSRKQPIGSFGRYVFLLYVLSKPFLASAEYL